MSDQYKNHLETGVTNLCHCWWIAPKNMPGLGFTNHDRELAFDNMRFRPNEGFTGSALEQATGLSVDNAEVLGILSHVCLSEEDIRSGTYDGAKIYAWWVSWADTNIRKPYFHGEIGQIQWSDGFFRAEIRGLSDLLNQPQGRVFQSSCSAILGDTRCRVDLSNPRYRGEFKITQSQGLGRYTLIADQDYRAEWFQSGLIELRDGEKQGQVRAIKTDVIMENEKERCLELWTDFTVPLAVGARVSLVAGCDKSAASCQKKFNNFECFRGFPHMPVEDWLMSYPVSGAVHDGGSLLS